MRRTYNSNPLFPTALAIQWAYAADRVNQGQYVKDEIRDPEDYSKIITYTNKSYVLNTAKAYYNEANPDSVLRYSMDHVPLLTVTDEDRENAAKVEGHFKRYTLKILGDDLTEFQRSIYTAVSSEEVPAVTLATLSYLPTFIRNEMKDIAYKKRLRTEFSESAHFNTQKHVEGEAEILAVYRKTDRETGDIIVTVVAAINGNLVSFYNAKFNNEHVGLKLHIKGRVKDFTNERSTRLPMTRINYVKVNLNESR